MKPENINNLKIQKAAYKNRIKLREKLEAKVVKLNPALHPNRCRQLIGQLNRLDKKIAEYEAKIRDSNTGTKE